MNNYLSYLKWKEFEATKGYFLPAKPIERVLDKIKQSNVYSVLKKLPKGGNMHLHQSKRKMYCFLNRIKIYIYARGLPKSSDTAYHRHEQEEETPANIST